MIQDKEDPLALAECSVRQLEKGVARQLAIVAELERTDGHDAAIQARQLLVTLGTSLGLARQHLRGLRHERVADDRDGAGS